MTTQVYEIIQEAPDFFDVYYAGTDNHRETYKTYEECLEHIEWAGGLLRTYIGTGHEYREQTIAEVRQQILEFNNDPLCQILQQAIQNEINNEFIRTIRKSNNDKTV
jgi:hypothetical protein